jgi:aryl-alcohol dehydrogenase-like predicted oxidoreductase
MIYRELGRTGIQISVLSLGTGGYKILGQRETDPRPEAEMHSLIHRAHALGVTHFDTSPAYLDSELILGRALKSLPRDSFSVSTKAAFASEEHIMKPEEVRATVERSLQRMQLNYIDVMLVGGPKVEFFDLLVNEHIPVLQQMQKEGKIRFIGSSEVTSIDGSHEWLKKLLPLDMVDVVMVGHNMINQSAQRSIFPLCKEKNIGVINIFTVRNLFWNHPRLEEVIADLKQRGLVDSEDLPEKGPLDWLFKDGEVDSLVEAAYRYAAYTEPVSTVMCGTINIPELKDDIRFVEKGPLSSEKREKLASLFVRIEESIGN